MFPILGLVPITLTRMCIFFGYAGEYYFRAETSGQRGCGGLFGQKDPFEVYLKMTVKNLKMWYLGSSVD